jgi:hypothetical protein
MNQNKSTFESENLVVDYFELKFDVLPEHIKQKIVQSFFKLGFNSFDVDKKCRDPVQDSIQTNSKNQYQIQFVVNISSYWNGVCVSFPGQSGAFFYQLSKEKKIDWNLFDSANINRFDLNYLRPIHPSQERQVADFFKQSEQTIHSKGINYHINSTKKELSLKIASKRSNRCAKIYDVGRKGQFLKFEMEIRRNLIADYKSDFLSNNFEKIEDFLIREFLNYFWKLLPLKNKYTDWLSQKVRPIANNARISIGPYISTDYIKSEKSKLSALSLKNFIMLLKFIRFTKELDYDIQKFDNILYRVIIFRVKDFSDVCDSMFKSDNNFYKVSQVKGFLRQLQQNIFLEIFNDSDFIQTLAFQHESIVEMDSLTGIPRVTLFKQPGSKYLLARVVLMDNLFHYQYPFRLPDLFEVGLTDRKLTKYEKLVRVESIRTLSSKDVEKRFYIRQFFNTYKISNKKIKEIKQIFIDLIHTFQQYQLIEDEGSLMPNRSPINIHNLTTSNISDRIILYEKFNTNSFLSNKV